VDEFDGFVAARGASLRRTAYLLTGDWHLAEDLLQAALLRTYERRRRLRDLDRLEPYTRRVLVTTFTSWTRRRSFRERPTEHLPDRPGADATEAYAERDRVWSAVKALPPRQRAVLVLRYYEDRSEAEIADLLGVSPGTVKSHASRALDALRDALPHEEPA
jgi:RNA polymerase sigma-70 factor (sigma-E family)